MKSALIVFLAMLAIVLGFRVYSLQKELLRVSKNAVFNEKRSDYLERKLMRVNRAYNEKERLLAEIEQGITELESKVQLETLERYVPKKTWDEIKPIVDRLQVFLEVREKNILPDEESN